VTLSHEFEHYVCLDDEAVKANLNMRKFSKEYFKNVPPSEFKKLPRQGGFLGSLFSEKWLRIWDEASTEIVSTLLVDSNPTAYRPCIYFLATAVVINKKNINDLKLARRSGNVDFLYSLVPKNILEDISVIGLALLRNRNNTVFLERLNQRLGDYYSFLEEAGKLSSYSNFEKSQIKDTIFEYSRIGFNKDEAEKNSFRKNVFRKLSKNSEIDR
jgi:hypothetical protein